MRTRHRTTLVSSSGWRSGERSGALVRAFFIAASLSAAIAAARASQVPVVKGGLGPCTADFTVTDSASKPLYDAKINVTILYGFMNKRKSELENGTNSDGKARFEGLPAKVKKPLEFHVRHGQHTKSVDHNPATDCQASFTVTLGTP